MKKFSIILTMLMLVSTIACQENKGTTNGDSKDRIAKPEKLSDRFGYLVGSTMGQNFKRDSIYDANYEYILQGIKDVLEDNELLLTPEELDSTNGEIQIIINERNQRQMLAKRQFTEANKEESFKFLEENKKKKGVVTMPSGLQYKVINKGAGYSPRDGDYLKVHVVGRILNGKEFDNSYKRNEPINLQLSQDKVVRCWYEALTKMKKRSKWIIYSPAELAFGEEGMQDIPANKAIIFELELLDFQLDPYDPDNPMGLPPGNPDQMESQSDTFKFGK